MTGPSSPPRQEMYSAQCDRRDFIKTVASDSFAYLIIKLHFLSVSPKRDLELNEVRLSSLTVIDDVRGHAQKLRRHYCFIGIDAFDRHTDNHIQRTILITK